MSLYHDQYLDFDSKPWLSCNDELTCDNTREGTLYAGEQPLSAKSSAKPWNHTDIMHPRSSANPRIHDATNALMIPRKIHCIWVGHSPKPDLVLQCMESWRKFLPDYELVEWGNREFQNIKNTYAEQAFTNRKWAFVSDYIRLHALYHQGGIYLDGDLEITHSLDEFLHLSFFSGYENYRGSCLPITTAMMAAEPGNAIVKALLDEYETAKFQTDEGLDQTPNTLRVSRYFAARFNIHPPYNDTCTTQLDENSIIFPASHFCTPVPGLPNYAVHHFNGSWKDGFTRKRKLKLPKGLSLVRFRKASTCMTNILPLAVNERLLFRVHISKRKILALIRYSDSTS